MQKSDLHAEVVWRGVEGSRVQGRSQATFVYISDVAPRQAVASAHVETGHTSQARELAP